MMNYEMYDNILTLLVMILGCRIVFQAIFKKKTEAIDAAIAAALIILWWIQPGRKVKKFSKKC